MPHRQTMFAATVMATSRVFVRAYAPFRYLRGGRLTFHRQHTIAEATSSLSSNSTHANEERQVIGGSIVMGTTLGSEDYDGILDLADTLPLMYEEEEDDTGDEAWMKNHGAHNASETDDEHDEDEEEAHMSATEGNWLDEV